MAINVRKADRDRYLRKAYEACAGDVEKVLVWDELGLELGMDETLTELVVNHLIGERLLRFRFFFGGTLSPAGLARAQREDC
jgi:hypothetical protein